MHRSMPTPNSADVEYILKYGIIRLVDKHQNQTWPKDH